MRGMASSCATLIMVAIFVFFCVLTACANYVQEKVVVETVTGVVTEKYIKRYGEADYFHVVLQKPDGTTEVFWNKDALFWGKFNSADVQQQIVVGKTYQFTVCGWRVPLFSLFRNITEVRALDK